MLLNMPFLVLRILTSLLSLAADRIIDIFPALFFLNETALFLGFMRLFFTMWYPKYSGLTQPSIQ
jgi:hypothetical protein